MKRKNSVLAWSGMLMSIGLLGCSVDEGATSSTNTQGSDSTQKIKGMSILSLSLAQRSNLQIVESDSDVAILLKGHADDSAVLRPIMDRVNQSKTYAEVYRNVTGRNEIPENILALDRKYTDPNGISPVLVVPSGPSENSSPALSRKSTEMTAGDGNEMAEPPWDWTGDCTWFLNLSPNTCDSRWSATNVTYAWIYRESKEHWAHLMAASHVNGSDVTVEEWNGSAWTTVFSQYTEPRTYWSFWYGSSSGSAKYRKFSNYGRGGEEARTHSHVGWNIQGGGDIGQICFHSYVCQTPQG